jgi:hypothetical protein
VHNINHPLIIKSHIGILNIKHLGLNKTKTMETSTIFKPSIEVEQTNKVERKLFPDFIYPVLTKEAGFSRTHERSYLPAYLLRAYCSPPWGWWGLVGM